MAETTPTQAGFEETPAVEQRSFPCAQCGGKLSFAPGTDELVCPYCNHRNSIPKSDQPVEEQDFGAALAKLEQAHEVHTHDAVKCQACGATPKMPPNATSMTCPFCGNNIVSQARATSILKPDAVLPFAVDQTRARAEFQRWIRRLWFAPGELKNFVRQESRLNGMYVPYWTYDTRVTTWYEGQRGDAYYVPVTYTVMVNGRPQVRTRMERRIRWTPVSGVVNNAFDDLLVLASSSLPRERAEALEPWDLKAAVPYKDEYLSGFGSEGYSLGLREGFEVARGIMAPVIEQTICADIGGDEQSIGNTRQRFDSITFKHILLPVWISAYRYRGKVFRILVNARTGEVQGQRPYSAWKIAGAVVGGLLVVGVIALIVAIANR